MKKKIIILAVVIFILMLIPMPLHLKDGGTIEYKALLYKYTKIHRLSEKSSTGYEEGWELKILGNKVGGEVNTYVESEDNSENKEKQEDIVLSIKNESLSAKSVTIILKNISDDTYLYGPEFYVQKLNNDKWEEISTVTGDPLTWNSIAYNLKSQEEKEEPINFENTYGILSLGKYRIIKRVFKEKDTPITEIDIIKVNVEFEIK